MATEKKTAAKKAATKKAAAGKNSTTTLTVPAGKEVKITKAVARNAKGDTKDIPLSDPAVKAAEVSLGKAVAKKTTPAAKKPAVKKADAPKVEKQVVPTVQFKNSAVPTPGTRARELKRFPLIPIHSTDSTIVSCFSTKSPVDVNLDEGTITVDSGFLAFNRSVDLLLLSCSQEWHEKGYTTSMDTVAEDLKLLGLHAKVNGVETVVSLNPDEHPFVTKDEGNTRHIETVVIFKHGVEEKRCLIQVKGHVDLVTGRIFLNGGSTDENVVALGYYLQGSRQRYV